MTEENYKWKPTVTKFNNYVDIYCDYDDKVKRPEEQI